MNRLRTDEPAAPAALIPKRLGNTMTRAWFTTIATALVWGAFLGAVPAAFTVVVPFAVFFIVPVAIVGSVFGVAAALGASTAVAASWRLIETRRSLGFAVAALGGFLGSAALIPISRVLVPNDQTPIAVYLGIAVVAGLIAATQLPRFTRRLAEHRSWSSGIAQLALLAAMGSAAVASALAAVAANLGGTGWAAADEACRETHVYGGLVRRVVAYIPAQSTCVYRDASVETIARSDHALIALVAGLGLLAVVAAWVLLIFRNRAHAIDTQPLALVAATTTLLLLSLFGSSLYGALGPVITGASLRT